MRYGILSLGMRAFGLGTLRRDLLLSLMVAGSAYAGWRVGEFIADVGFASWVSLAASSSVAILAWIAAAVLLARHEGLSLRALARSATA
jgi:hypothetical protein